MGTFVPSTRTVWTPAQAAMVIGRAYVRVRAKVPGPRVLACLVGQWAAETLHGRECRNNCPGNVRASLSAAGLYTLRPAGEVIKGRQVYFHPPETYPCEERAAWLLEHPDSQQSVAGSCFRAFATAEDGADDYVAFLARRSVLEAAESGDPDEFSAALKRRNYFTADLAHYSRMMRSTFARYLPAATNACATLNELQAKARGFAGKRSGGGLERTQSLTNEHIDRLIDMQIDWDDLGDVRRQQVADLNEQ